MINIKKILIPNEEVAVPYWLDRLIDKWNRFIGYKITDFVTGVKNIIKWTPIIWKDRDWDDSYIFTILKTKLYFTAKCFIDNARYEGYERDVERITTCIKLIEYIKEEHYENQVYDELEKKYGELKISSKPSDKEGFNTVLFQRPNIENGLYAQAEYELDHSAKFKIAYEKHLKARKLLFKILENHIERWWA